MGEHALKAGEAGLGCAPHEAEVAQFQDVYIPFAPDQLAVGRQVFERRAVAGHVYLVPSRVAEAVVDASETKGVA